VRSRKRFSEAAGRKLGVEAARIETHLLALLVVLENRAREEVEKSDRPVFAAPRAPTEEERREALAFLREPDVLSRIARDLDALGCVGEEPAKRLAALVERPGKRHLVPLTQDHLAQRDCGSEWGRTKT